MTSAFDIKSLAEFLAQEDEEFGPSPENYESNPSLISGQFGNYNGIYSEEEEEANLKAKRASGNGFITKMLQNSLGVLPPNDRLPANSIKNHKINNLDMITKDKVPIFLGEKYFKFGNNAKQPSNNNKAEKKYYTGREIYMMKRNHTKLNEKKST